MEDKLSEKCLKLLRIIPKGRVTTYKALADAIGIKSCRAIGQILKRNKFPEIYPCYKVIRSDGSIGGYYGKESRMIKIKMEKLRNDGIEIIDNKVDLSRFLFSFFFYKPAKFLNPLNSWLKEVVKMRLKELNEPNKLELRNSAYMNLLRTVIESASREPTGFLFGFRKKFSCIFVDAYPIISADKTPTGVSYGNLNAISRIRKLNNLMNFMGKNKSKWLGGFHSHPYKQGNNPLALTQLSDDNLEFIQNEMKAHKKGCWIEVIARFRELKTKSPLRIGKKIKFLKKKMEIAIIDSPYHKYKILLSAYLVLKREQKGKKGPESKKANQKMHKSFDVREIKIKIKK